MKEVSLYAQYISPPSHQRWVVSSYGGLPSIVSRECTNKGILLSKNNEGLVCVSCNDLRIARGCSNPSVTLDKWYADLDRCLDRRNRQVITARDNADALLFTKKTQSEFTPAGIELMEEAKALVDYYSYMSRTRLPAATVRSISGGEVPAVKTVFDKAADLYEKNPEFRSSVIVALLKGAVAKATFGKNTATEERCVNFFRYMRSISKTAFSALRETLGGPSSRWMEKLNAREKVPCIVDSGKDGELVVKRMADGIIRRCPNFKEGDKNQAVTFTIGVDATKVAPSLELSARYQVVLGGEHPNDIIPINGKSKEEVKAILDGTSRDYGEIPKATEIKVAVMSFQSSPDGVPVYEIVAARPQSNNESNDFVKDMEKAASAAMALTGVHGSSFLNTAVDGVSCESRNVQESTCDFLSCKSNHTGTTDPNHNCKSWRYQIVAGGDSTGCTIGRFVIDVGLLRLSDV